MNRLTQSSASVFRTCRKRFQFEHEMNLRPIAEEPHELFFGQQVHAELEAYHANRPPISADPMIHAIMAGYAARWATDDWTHVKLETEFTHPLVNDWVAAGKRDGVIRRNGKLWVLEHKTTSRIDATYIEKLWMDWQIIFYVWATQLEYGETVAGVLYNVIEKTATHQGMGETDDEWNARLAEAKQPNRCKRKEPESDAAYAARLAATYANPAKYHREEILFTQEDIDACRAETLEIVGQITDARARQTWYRNTASCYQWNRPCKYLQICKSRDSQVVIENLYRVGTPHGELAPLPDTF